MLKIILHWFSLKERKVLIRWSGCFFTFVSLLFIILGLRYFFLYSLPKEPFGLFYTFTAFISQFVMLGYIPWLLIVFPLSILFPIRKLIVPLSIVIASLMLSILLLDSLVFAENRFHFNSLTIRILGFKTWGFGIVYLFIFIGFTSFLGKWAWQKFIQQGKRVPWLFITVTTLTLFLTTHILHAWADANYYTPITRFTTYLPFFYPTTARRFMIKYGLVDPERSREEKLVSELGKNSKSDLNYPLKPLKFQQVEKQKNMLLIVIDAMRYDVLTEDLAPNIVKFADSAAVFENHYSGGNSTRMGMFSLFYGLPGTYWQYFKSMKRAPVLMDAFMSNRYQLGIFSSAPLYAPPALDRTAFAKIRNLRMNTEIPGRKRAFAKDSAITDEWREWLNTRNVNKPFFGFLFFDALRLRSFPPAYQSRGPHQPNAPKMHKWFNKYKIAMQYVDSLVGIVLDDIIQHRLLDESIIIITSDHGEEFNEAGFGYAKHGTAYSDYQLRVPLVVYWPDKAACSISRRTSHNDIAATVMSGIFYCSNPPSDYCSGNDLFSGVQWEWLIVGSYYNFAILEPEQVTVQYPGGYFELRDRDYRIIAKPQINRNALTLAFNEVGRFFKK